ncbi:hypothetical protein ICHIJ1_13230 [Fluviibacter phosphoraccumulans]|nr:hypothetical protein ICHIJ1_13230 [Fluviibacter phosphoraccumulans]
MKKGLRIITRNIEDGEVGKGGQLWGRHRSLSWVYARLKRVKVGIIMGYEKFGQILLHNRVGARRCRAPGGVLAGAFVRV